MISVELFISILCKPVLHLIPEKNAHLIKYKILIPAHNEAEIIGLTLSNLLKEKVLAHNIILVADNCTDSTAAIANDIGVKVLERQSSKQRGKGFALDYGIKYLKHNDVPDIVIILDADCEIEQAAITALLQKCMKNNKPQQALYFMRNQEDASLKQKIAGFAWFVKNKIRPTAINYLNLPVTLTGTGMAFPWLLIQKVDVANGNIVEDMQLGIDCTLLGQAPQLCEQATVYSEFPVDKNAAITQRTRWEHGHLSIIIKQVPKLISQAIIQRDIKLFLLALDIGVPPLALLILMSVIVMMITGFFAACYGGVGILSYFLLSFCIFLMMLFIIWNRVGREYLTFRELASVPSYVISKLSLYIAFIFKRQKAWIRTSRTDKSNDS